MDEYTIISGKTNKTEILALKEQGFFIGLQKVGLVISFL